MFPFNLRGVIWGKTYQNCGENSTQSTVLNRFWVNTSATMAGLDERSAGMAFEALREKKPTVPETVEGEAAPAESGTKTAPQEEKSEKPPAPASEKPSEKPPAPSEKPAKRKRTS